MEDYFPAKRMLFESTVLASSIVNIDDEYGRDWPRISTRSPTGCGRGRRFRATDIEFDATGRVSPCDEAARPGRNSASRAIQRGKCDGGVGGDGSLGVSPAIAVEALARATGRPAGSSGRRREPSASSSTTPTRPIYSKTSWGRGRAAARRVIAVVGAGGDRDRTKRPLMGARRGQRADVVYVTSDNPRSEDPAAITTRCSAARYQAESAAQSGVEVHSEIDRRAIEHAVAEAEEGDIVLIVGKGHEQGQEFADGRKIPFDDATVARESLRQLEAVGWRHD